MSTYIVLFFKNDLIIDYEKLVKKIEECYKDFKTGIIFNNINNPNYPNFIFKDNQDLSIEGNNHHIAINILNDYVKEKNYIIESLWDAFDYCDLSFERVGYINEFYKNIENLEHLKNKILNKNINKNIDEFQLSFHNDIIFKRKNINCWKRFVKMSNTPLMVTYDINTKIKNFKEINYKILKELIKFSDNYIENDIKEFIKEGKI